MIKVIMIILFFAHYATAAVNIGQWGKTYPIAEPDVLKEIEARAAQVDWQKAYNAQRMDKRIRNFQPADAATGISIADKDSVRLIDMTWTSPDDITDPNGRIVYPSGFTFNPLDVVAFGDTWIIIDGSRPEQVAWFDSSEYRNRIDVQLLMMNGRFIDSSRYFDRPVYAVTKTIADRLQLRATPSIVQQQGNQLSVTEISLTPLDESQQHINFALETDDGFQQFNIPEQQQTPKPINYFSLNSAEPIAWSFAALGGLPLIGLILPRTRKRSVALFITAMILLGSLVDIASATCKGKFLNPITDVCWHCMFPVKIAGISVVSSSLETPPGPESRPLCICPLPPPLPPRIGIPVSFYEPARVIETVRTPWCFPSLGVGNQVSVGKLSGSTRTAKVSDDGDEAQNSAQAHWIIFPVWSVMELFIDFVCLESSGFDIAYLTEIDLLWQSDTASAIMTPESLLFANMFAQISCIPDAIASNIGLSLPPLFWCMGSWGSAYPFTGHINLGATTQANAGLAARMIYKLSRSLLIHDTAVNLCMSVPLPIWVKHHYRMHIVRPIRDFTCHPIGRSGLIWDYLKNPPVSGMSSEGNFAWILFRKRACCAL